MALVVLNNFFLHCLEELFLLDGRGLMGLQLAQLFIQNSIFRVRDLCSVELRMLALVVRH